MLKGVHSGARLYVIDPRRTTSAQWADAWLGLDVGSDIALANAMGREILAAGLANQAFIANATTDFEAYRASVERYTLDYAERETGVPAELIRVGKAERRRMAFSGATGVPSLQAARARTARPRAPRSARIVVTTEVYGAPRRSVHRTGPCVPKRKGPASPPGPLHPVPTVRISRRGSWCRTGCR